MPLIRYRLSIILMAGSKYFQINFCYYITNRQAAPAPAPPQSSGILAILPSSNVRYCPQHPALLLGRPPCSMQPLCLCFVNYLKYVQFFSPFGFLRRRAPAGVMREYFQLERWPRLGLDTLRAGSWNFNLFSPIRWK